MSTILCPLCHQEWPEECVCPDDLPDGGVVVEVTLTARLSGFGKSQLQKDPLALVQSCMMPEILHDPPWVDTGVFDSDSLRLVSARIVEGWLP